MTKFIDLRVMPRETMSWSEFVEKTPECSIALDGIVHGGPKIDLQTKHINFDHHDNVVREATMSSAKQAYFAVKGGLFDAFRKEGNAKAQVYINDTDQDTALATFILDNYKMFERTNSIPSFSKLLDVTDKLDITGGFFPISMHEKIIRQRKWIFEPYTQLRQEGTLAVASAQTLQDNIESTLSRMHQFIMGEAEERPIVQDAKILYVSEKFMLIDERNSYDGRMYLISKGMNAFISLLAMRPDGKHVYTIGKRSQYIDFPVQELYNIFNQYEGLTTQGWNGSDIIGGSSRYHGSKIPPQELVKITEEYLKR